MRHRKLGEVHRELVSGREQTGQSGGVPAPPGTSAGGQGEAGLHAVNASAGNNKCLYRTL